MINLSDSKKVYDYLRYVYNLTNEKYVKQNGLNLAGHCKDIGLESVYFDLVKSNFLDLDKDKLKWISIEPHIQMANALIDEAKKLIKEAANSTTSYNGWTVKDVDTLIKMKDAGNTFAEIAELLGRKQSSITNKYYREKKSSPKKDIKGSVTGKWSKTEESELLSMLENKYSIGEIAHKLKRGYKTTESKIYSMNKKTKNSHKLIQDKKEVHENIRKGEKPPEGVKFSPPVIIATPEMIKAHEEYGNLHKKLSEKEAVIDKLNNERTSTDSKDKTHYYFKVNKIFLKIPVAIVFCLIMILIGYYIK